ncbi:MAG: DUF6524 family protein [Halocynthiibacter sp.]
MAYFLRWAFAFVLLAATFNPTEWNYTRWAMVNYLDEMPVTLLLGLLLVIGYIVYLRATLRSIGGFGMFLVFAVVAAMIWVLSDWGILTLANTSVQVWLAIFSISVVLGVGLSWSHVRRALSGQSDMDDIDD